MTLGKPIIGTRGASFEEMITDGENGFLVSPNEPEQLAERINAVWKDPRLQEIGKAARLRAQDFAPEQTVQELLSYYREILNKIRKANELWRRKMFWWSRGGSNP